VLLEHGADVGAEDEDGKTALEVSSSERHDEIMKLLGAR
jgi:ankyrin repeat protein